MVQRGRFAPTPSGLLHIGNAFSALAAWLQIRQVGGQFILRIEDIDRQRSRASFAQQQQDDLLWLGIDWDEGPGLGGPFEPYEQSRRDWLYEAALEELRKKDRLHPCYCSRKDLNSIASAPHGIASEGATYPGYCRQLTAQERQMKEAQKTPSLRFIMPSRPVSFQDGSVGFMQYSGDALGDFVVKRADGMYSYQLAVIVDDAAMSITNVLRGADLLDSTPRQLALCEALNLQPPNFTHVPIVVDECGERLSKRDQSLTLASLRYAGVKPERLIGAIAYIAGWLNKFEPITAHELIPAFQLTHFTNKTLTLSGDILQQLHDV